MISLLTTTTITQCTSHASNAQSSLLEYPDSSLIYANDNLFVCFTSCVYLLLKLTRLRFHEFSTLDTQCQPLMKIRPILDRLERTSPVGKHLGLRYATFIRALLKSAAEWIGIDFGVPHSPDRDDHFLATGLGAPHLRSNVFPAVGQSVNGWEQGMTTDGPHPSLSSSIFDPNPNFGIPDTCWSPGSGLFASVFPSFDGSGAIQGGVMDQSSPHGKNGMWSNDQLNEFQLSFAIALLHNLVSSLHSDYCHRTF